MSFLIKDALAAADSAVSATTGTVTDAVNTASTQPAADGTFSIIMMVAMVAIFYFLLWRPQSKRAKEHRNLISGLQKGDEISTSGGILGKITHVEEKFLVVSIAEGTEIKLQRAAVSAVLPKGTLKAD